jgi:hypothetical protein
MSNVVAVDGVVDPLRQTHVEVADLRAPHQVRHAFEEIGQPDGRHEEDDRLLPHEVTEDEALHQPGEPDHHHDRQQDRRKRRHLPAEIVDVGPEDLVDQMPEGNAPLLDAHKRHRRE